MIIILSIISILTADISREAMLELVSKIPGGFGERMASVYSSNAIFIVPSILCIIISLIILFYVLFNKIHSRNLILTLSIICFLFSSNTFVSILAIINIIVSATIKNESVSKEKKDIPKLDRYSCGIKGLVGAGLCFVIYFSQSFIPNFNNYFISIIKYLIVLGLLIFIFKDNMATKSIFRL